MKKALLLVAAALIAQGPAVAQVQTWPNRPITLIVPFPAGSTTDNVARKLAEYMRSKTNWTFLVDNKAGADGNIAAQFVLRQPADGYTVFITGNSVHGANANLFKELPFDPIRDFEPIGGMMVVPMVLTVRQDFPANDVNEFVAEARKRSKPLFYATGNNSTRGASEIFKLRYNFSAEHVPYKGSPQVVTDLVAGQFDFAFIDANTVRPFLADGRLKGLAITSEKRLPTLPTVPTVAEGLPGFQFGAWAGAVVRARTPPEVKARLEALVDGYARDPAIGAYFRSINSAAMPMTPAQLGDFIESETRAWAEIVKAANIEKK